MQYKGQSNLRMPLPPPANIRYHKTSNFPDSFRPYPHHTHIFLSDPKRTEQKLFHFLLPHFYAGALSEESLEQLRILIFQMLTEGDGLFQMPGCFRSHKLYTQHNSRNDIIQR